MPLNGSKVKNKLYTIIFDTDTAAGKAFDIILIILILCNTILTIFESIDSIRNAYGMLLTVMGWFFLLIFAIEYLFRVLVVKKKWAYILSFYGIIDLLAILPLFLGLFLPYIRFLAVFRVFRLLRIFSILEMGRYINESSKLISALRASKAKITVFIAAIFFIIVIIGSFMYIIEGPENGFNSIPVSMYWAIVTVSTVGYGDISPQTSFGKIISSLLMIIGYGVLAVPTGIISHELAQSSGSKRVLKVCPNCNKIFYDKEAHFCSKCGAPLDN